MGIMARARSWNWWRIGFFAMLLLFEAMRELLVIAEAAPATVIATKEVRQIGDDVYVRGYWRRTDENAPLMQTAVSIECRRDRGECLEADSSAYQRTFMPPDLRTYSATFAPGSVSYSNDEGPCVREDVHIDVTQKRVIGTRQKKPGANKELCAGLEREIETEVAGGLEHYDPLKGHFVPVLSFVSWIARATR